VDRCGNCDTVHLRTRCASSMHLIQNVQQCCSSAATRRGTTGSTSG
jgi:hypothetical protein